MHRIIQHANREHHLSDGPSVINHVENNKCVQKKTINRSWNRPAIPKPFNDAICRLVFAVSNGVVTRAAKDPADAPATNETMGFTVLL